MSKMTEKDYMSFKQIYENLPDRSAVKAPKTEFVEQIAALTMKSPKTVRCWIAGVQKPDALAQSLIQTYMGIPCDVLFPKNDET